MDFKILNKKNSREKNMTKQENYYAEVFEKPWGRMFYDLLFPQLLPNLTKDSKILSFGSGFGRTETFWRNRDLKSRAMSLMEKSSR